MGVVYEAHDTKLDCKVAVKVLTPGHSLDRFRREAKLLARVRSPHVVTVFDFEELPNHMGMLSMEWISGQSLKSMIQGTATPVQEEPALGWMRHTCKAMSAVAERGVVHRDLKPSNILIDVGGEARVSDFGLAVDPALADDLTRSGTIVGTPHYMAPEQAENARAVDARSDIYSFGATYYHALTGAPPFQGGSTFSVLYKHKAEPLPSPRARNPLLSTVTSELLERCLAKAPGDRFQSFNDILKLLQSPPGEKPPWAAFADERLDDLLARFNSRCATYSDDQHSLGEGDEYELPNGRRIIIVRGHIAGQEVDAVVSSDDDELSMDGGVSKAIRRGGGEEIYEEARRLIPVRAGRAVVTTAGSLKARFVFHGVTLGNTEKLSRDLITEIVRSCFYHADSLMLESIAFPLLGTGAGGFSKQVCLDTIFRFAAKTLLVGLTTVRTVRIVLFEARP
jgi:serine/threonine protein kinase